MSIAIVGDVHIAPPPGSRIDDYFHVGLDKITQIVQNADRVVFLGDIFSCPKVEEKYISALIHHLCFLMATYNVKFYSIVGNHDVANELESKLYNSSLGVLHESGCIDIILPDKPIPIEGYKFHTVPVRFRDVKPFLENKIYTPQDILLIHHEYETGTNRLTYEDLKNLGCKHVFFGHDHCPMEGGRIIYPELTVYRSGSLMRNIAIDYNFSRQIYYYIIDGDKISCKAIEQQDATQIFTHASLCRENYHKKKYQESINSIINKYKNTIEQQQNKFSMENILKELNAPAYVTPYIKAKYEKFGERFN